MTVAINLESIPNQNFTAVLDGLRYDVTIKTAHYYMVCDVVINGDTVITGQRILNGAPLIPYRHLENGGGNFAFLTDTDEDPWYEFFGNTQILVYFTAEELGAVRGI